MAPVFISINGKVPNGLFPLLVIRRICRSETDRSELCLPQSQRDILLRLKRKKTTQNTFKPDIQFLYFFNCIVVSKLLSSF